MQDNPYFLQYSQNCENSKKSINNSKNNNEFCLKNDFTKINNSNKNYLENTNKKANDNYLNNKNFTPFKNNYNNVSYKNNVTQNGSMSCKNSVSSKRGLSCQSKACYKSTAYYENGINYKSCTTRCSATTKICLWLFLFVACLAVTIGVGCANGSNGNGSLKVTPAVETISAAGETWSGSGTQANPYQIGTYADLLALSTACNTSTGNDTSGNPVYEHFQGKYFKLTADITIAAADLDNTTSTSTTWTPIACDLAKVDGYHRYFSGIFDGGGHTITCEGDMAYTYTSYNTSAFYCGFLFGYVKGGGTGEAMYGVIQNLNMVISKFTFDISSNSGSCPGVYIGAAIGFAEDGVVSNCALVGDVVLNTGYKVSWGGLAGIVGKAQSVVGCSFSGVLDINVTNHSGYLYVGAIAGEASVSKCYIELKATSKISIYGGDECRRGIIVSGGKASNCYVSLSMTTLSLTGTVAESYWLNGSNCIMVINNYPTTVSGIKGIFASGSSNCIIIGMSTESIDTTKGLYALTSTNTNLDELKNKTTYTLGTSNFLWSSSAPWSFANSLDETDTGIWYLSGTGTDYPMLKQFYVEPMVNITLNVTTNLSGSTSSSTSGSTPGSSGSSSTTATANPADQFIIYRLDESGNVVNQFVVRNGSTVTFEVDKNKSFTIMINYKLYMVTTIGSESTNKKTFTPTADTTISIHITAPANVNNWIVI